MQNKKESNRIYYENNKLKIAEKLYTKEECECCGRVISHQNMSSHKKTTYCRKIFEKRNNDTILNKVKENMELFNLFYDISKQ